MQARKAEARWRFSIQDIRVYTCRYAKPKRTGDLGYRGMRVYACRHAKPKRAGDLAYRDMRVT